MPTVKVKPISETPTLDSSMQELVDKRIDERLAALFNEGVRSAVIEELNRQEWWKRSDLIGAIVETIESDILDSVIESSYFAERVANYAGSFVDHSLIVDQYIERQLDNGAPQFDVSTIAYTLINNNRCRNMLILELRRNVDEMLNNNFENTAEEFFKKYSSQIADATVKKIATRLTTNDDM